MEWRIRRMIGESLGCDVEELDRSYRLKADLGMEGVRAKRFFKEYGHEFHVDLSQLWEGWSFFFTSQGAELSTATRLALAVAASAGLLEWLLFPHFSGVAGFVTVFGIFLILRVSIEIAQRLNPGQEKPDMQEITIDDLLQAAKSGSWKVPQEIEAWLSKRKQFHPFN